jgi:hypothetical protein
MQQDKGIKRRGENREELEEVRGGKIEGPH